MKRNSIIFLSALFLSVQAMEDKQTRATTKAQLAALHSALITSGNLVPEQVQGIPQWPQDIPGKCRTIQKLTAGPYRGERATIERSLWSLKGIDTIYSTTDVKYIYGSGSMPLISFYLELQSFDEDGFAPLYYGHIGTYGHIIPATWLSDQDQTNLYNFHRYELASLASQLFDPQSPSRALLRSKINSELDEERIKFLSRVLNSNRQDLLHDPDCISKVKEWQAISKQMFENIDKSDYSCPLLNTFLHAVLLEAFKYADEEILFNRKILYNSLGLLNDPEFKALKKNAEEPPEDGIRQKIVALLPCAHIMRNHNQIDNDTFYTDLLPKDVRLEIARYLYRENKNKAYEHE